MTILVPGNNSYEATAYYLTGLDKDYSQVFEHVRNGVEAKRPISKVFDITALSSARPAKLGVTYSLDPDCMQVGLEYPTGIKEDYLAYKRIGRNGNWVVSKNPFSRSKSSSNQAHRRKVFQGPMDAPTTIVNDFTVHMSKFLNEQVNSIKQNSK